MAEANKGRPDKDPLHKKLADFDDKLDALRKRIVATKEGGAITGEERLREHTDQLYGALNAWEGPPGRYQLDNIVALRAELDDIAGGFGKLTSTELPALNKALSGKGAKELTVPPPTAFDDDEPTGHGGGVAAGREDTDAMHDVQLPKNLRLWN